MNWQELVVAGIVLLAVVSLYRRFRDLMSFGKPSAPSCHGCDDCGQDPADGPVDTPVPTTPATK